MRHIEVIARGVIACEDSVLLCHTKGAHNTYLPGGHVEFGEPARLSLEREMVEELGIELEAGRFLGCIEHDYVQDGAKKAEINLVFEMARGPLEPWNAPDSMEEWIEFWWRKLDDLGSSFIEPSVLAEKLPAWLRSGGSERFISNIDMHEDNDFLFENQRHDVL